MHAVHLRRTVSVETTLLYLTLASSTFALFALFARAISRVMKRHFHRSLLSLSIFFLPSSFFFPLPFRSTSSSYCFVAPLNCILFDEAFFELARRLRTEQKRSQLFFSSRDSEKLFVAGLNCSKRSKGNYRENGFPPIAPFLVFCQLLFTCPFCCCIVYAGGRTLSVTNRVLWNYRRNIDLLAFLFPTLCILQNFYD